MKMRVQVVIDSTAGEPTDVHEIACLHRKELRPDTVGLTLEEAKTVLERMQQRIVEQQAAEYLRTRKQFGQPIGRFQALAHRMADLLTQCEQAQSLAWAAAMKLDPHTVDAAQVISHRAFRAIGQQAVQLHGGIGMTDEYAVSHYVKRLLAIELELGDVDTALARFAAHS